MQKQLEEAFEYVAKFKYLRRSRDGSVGIQEVLDSTLFFSLFAFQKQGT
jgi:hypothetical protein